MPTIADLIREAAIRYHIDPNAALRVYGSEGRAGYTGDYDALGNPTSFGPFQLHYAGSGNQMGGKGLGDAFTAATGLDARDQATVPQQVDFAMRNAAQGGWGPWHGAAKIGMGEWEGIKPGATPPAGAPVQAGVGYIKPVSPLEPQYATASGAMYPGSSDPKAIGTGRIDASFAQGTAGPALSPTNIAGEGETPAPVVVANLPNYGLGQAFAQALGSLTPRQSAYSTAPLQGGVRPSSLGGAAPNGPQPPVIV
jgi:hypothetical protein